MAAPTLDLTETLSNYPYLVKRFTFTAGTDATAFTHGEGAPHDLLWGKLATASPTANEITLYSATTSQFTLDCQAASGPVVVYAMWLHQAATDGQSISSDKSGGNS